MYRYYKEAVERGIDLCAKTCYPNEPNTYKNIKALNRLLEVVMNETTSEMDGLQVKYMEGRKFTNSKHIKESGTNIKNNYAILIELISDYRKQETYKSLSTEFSKLHDTSLIRYNNIYKYIDIQNIISQSNSINNKYHRIVEGNRDKDRHVVQSLSNEFDNIYDTLLMKINTIDNTNI